VTGNGAFAFADFFGRRLPTEVEWLHTAINWVSNPQSKLKGFTNSSNSMNTGGMMTSMREGDLQKDEWNIEKGGRIDNKNATSAPNTSKGPQPAASFERNTFSVRALNKGIGEWGVRDLSSLSEDKLQENLFVVMGVLEHESPVGFLSPVISRFPWEGFEEVGFRTVKSVLLEK
jgi:hypothetical protein